MNIFIMKSVGYGKTNISAFDNALANANVLNYNLIRLSSVIPPKSSLIYPEHYKENSEEFGYRLYCVYAEMTSAKVGEAIGAIIGSYQLEDGRGLFVEHETSGKSEAEVHDKLTTLAIDSLSDLCVTRRFVVDKNKFKLNIQTAMVTHSTVCTLVLAAYKADKW